MLPKAYGLVQPLGLLVLQLRERLNWVAYPERHRLHRLVNTIPKINHNRKLGIFRVKWLAHIQSLVAVIICRFAGSMHMLSAPCSLRTFHPSSLRGQAYGGG